MTKSNVLETPSSLVPDAEQLEDHNNKIEEYLQNCLFRGCSLETTLRDRAWILKAIFRRVEVGDLPGSASRQLFVWELLSPTLGPYYLSEVISSLIEDDVALSTERKYMSCLKDFCDYVLAKPHVPGSKGLSIRDKYGAIEAKFTKYDLVIHAADRSRRKRYALAPNLLNNFFEYIRLDYLPSCSLPHMGARDYTAVVLQAEIGARNSELVGIRSGGNISDIDQVKDRVRLFGKGAAYSGKRLRWVPLTPFAAQVVETFQKSFKPMFPKSASGDYLFLNEDGSHLTKYWYWKTFRKIVRLAKEAGVQIPDDLRPHDLRRTCATNQLHKNPLSYRKVLKGLGHSYPSSAEPYLLATDEDVDEQQSDLIDIFVNPHIDEIGEN